jgi:hypothetical protein
MAAVCYGPRLIPEALGIVRGGFIGARTGLGPTLSILTIAIGLLHAGAGPESWESEGAR